MARKEGKDSSQEDDNRLMKEIDFNSDSNDEQDELYEHHRYVADKNQGLLRIDKFIFNLLAQTSRNRIQQAAKAGSIWVNGKSVKPNYRVRPDDVVQIILDHPPREVELIAEEIPINVVYEDESFCIVNKEAGMVVHPGYANYTGTLVNAVLFRMKNLPSAASSERPGLVHRIDKDTSGLLVIALSDFAMVHISKQFFERSTDRLYTALVWGDLAEDNGTITGNLGRSLKDRKVMSVFPEGDFGKHAVTHYKVLERFGYVTLVECKLETGRTHQIRAHFQYIGHPLFGDPTYGGNKILKGVNTAKYKQFINNNFELLPRQALHARTLGLTHPISGERHIFESDLPEDMVKVLERWRNYSLYHSVD